MLKLMNSHFVVLGSKYLKKHFILQFVFNFKCSKLKHVQNLNLISLFIFLQEHKALDKQNFLEYFSIKDVKLSSGSFLTLKSKILLLPEMRVTRKIFTPVAANLFFLIK